MIKNFVLWIIVLFALFVSCKTNQNLVGWEVPNKQVNNFKLKRVLVVGLFKNDSLRHHFEDQLVFSLNGRGTASYNYLPPDFLVNMGKKKPKAKIKMEGFDGVLIIQSKNENKEDDYSKDIFPSRKSILSFEDFNIVGLFHHKPKNTNTTSILEVNLFSVKKDKFIWKGEIEWRVERG